MKALIALSLLLLVALSQTAVSASSSTTHDVFRADYFVVRYDDKPYNDDLRRIYHPNVKAWAWLREGDTMRLHHMSPRDPADRELWVELAYKLTYRLHVLRLLATDQCDESCTAP